MKYARAHLLPFTKPHPEIAVASAVSSSGGRAAGKYGFGMLCGAATNANGFDALWIPEVNGREIFTHASYLLGSTDRLILAAGIANVFMREPMTTIRAARTLAERFENRFILGLGVSNRAGNERRGLEWQKPYTFMKQYLEKMRSAPYTAPGPGEEPPIVLAAILPKMIELAATATSGTHTYFVTPEHTAKARAAIRPEKWICAEQAVMLETDAVKARTAARQYMGMYLRMPGSAYRKNLLSFGFEESDFAGDLSDRLVDAVVAWGSETLLSDRIEAHRRAGATHVCILPLRSDGVSQRDERVLEALSPRE